jgi:hypothetical protein
MNLVENLYLTASFVEFVGERENTPFSKIKIIEIDIEALTGITILVLDPVE